MKKLIYYIGKLLFDRKRDLVPTGKKVLVADCQKLGNYIFKTPMIKGLALGGYEVSILGSKVTKELAEANPYVKEVIIDNCYRKKSTDIFRNIKTGLKYRGKFDYFIELVGGIYLRDLILMNLLKAKKVIGIERKKGVKYKIIDIVIKRQPHMKDNGIEVLKSLGLDSSGIKGYDIHLKAGNRYENFKKDRPLILYNGTGSAKSKSIPLEKEREILDNLSQIEGVEVRKIEREKSVLDLCGLISKADVVVSVDTGVTHIASAFNIPIVVHSSSSFVYPISDIVVEHSFYEKDLYKVVEEVLIQAKKEKRRVRFII